jgi:single-stranded DNA-specific DHH superfamily exonuclease
VTAEDGALFSEDDLPHRMGRVEAGTQRAIEAGYEQAIIGDTDAGMAAAALLAARTLDRCETLPDKTAVYAIAQNMRPYQDAMHALRLPAALSPATVPSQPAENSQDSAPDWLRDAFGTPE